MTGFLKGFLLEDSRKLAGGQGFRLFLAAFGKHPGWDDHIEDIGLDTESLIAAKQNLYVNGIGRQIDTGGWDKLGAEQGIAEFKHSFAWVRGNQFILGRMWSSSDGKGRTRYPMVVCCHCVDLPLGITSRKIFPVLAKLEEACKGVKTAPEVRSLIARYLNEMRFAICDLSEDTSDPGALTEAESRVFDAIADKFQMEGMLRVFYQVQSHLGAFAPGKFNAKADNASVRPQHIRAPAVPDAPIDSLTLWSRLLRFQLDAASPRLFWLPEGQTWIDIVVGEPTEQEYFGLRANPKALPLTSEIPFTIDSESRGRTLNFLADFRNGKLTEVPGERASGLKSATTSFTQRFFKSGKKWFAGVAVLSMAAGVVAYKITTSPREPPKVAALAPTPTIVKSEPPTAPKPIAKAPTTVVPPPTVTQAPVQTAQAPQKKSPEPIVTSKPEPAVASVPQPEIKPQPVTVTPALPPAAVGTAAPRVVQIAAAKPPESVPVEKQPVQKQAVEKKSLTNSIGMEFVRLSDNLWVGRYEVTQAEFEKVVGFNPSRFQGDKRLPVDSVTWNEANKFCEQLTGLDQKAGVISKRAQYTLPTETQWDSFVGDARFEEAITSWGNVRTSTVPVGTSKMNQLGLYDVLGNVWEWCAEGAQRKTLKGAAYDSRTTHNFKPLTEKTALQLPPDQKSPRAGFRCVLVNQE